MVLVIITSWLSEVHYHVKALRAAKDGLRFIIDADKESLLALTGQDFECCVEWNDIAGWHVCLEELQDKNIREIFECGKV